MTTTNSVPPTIAQQHQPLNPEVSPQAGVPLAYRIPDQYRRNFGAHPVDRRGNAYFLAVGAFSSSVLSLLAVFFLAFIATGISLVPAVLGIVLGIMALHRLTPEAPMHFQTSARNYAIWSIVTGAIGVILSIGILLLSVWMVFR